MLEEFQEKPYLSSEDLIEYVFSFSDLLRLLDMGLVDEKNVTTYLSHLLIQGNLPHYEELIIRALWAESLGFKGFSAKPIRKGRGR